MLVAQASFYLTTIAFLGERGMRMPRDVSLVGREDETFLGFLKSAPARYACNPTTYAKRLLLQLQLAFAGETGAHTLPCIEPKCIAGDSLGSRAALRPDSPGPRRAPA